MLLPPLAKLDNYPYEILASERLTLIYALGQIDRMIGV
jgi:hypothetical protein